MHSRSNLAVSILSVFFCSFGFGQDKYALVVGVEVYDTDTFENLPYSDEDAREVGKALSGLGFQTMVMSSDASSFRMRPTNAQKILDQLQARLGSCANGDSLVVVLGGHGVQFKDEASLPSGVKETYFVPARRIWATRHPF
ncbi:MAG: caspase family protein [Pirellulaceae bacterium]